MIGILAATALSFWLLHRLFTAYERRSALQQFEAALEELSRDPDNKGRRDAAFVRGKTYWSVKRNGAELHPEDEADVHERIQAVIFRGTVPAKNRSYQRVGTARIANAPQLRRTKIERLPDGTWIISGRTRLRQLKEELGIDLGDDGPDTLGALVEQRLMRPAKFGDHVVIGTLDVAVTKVEDGRVSKLFVRRLKSADF